MAFVDSSAKLIFEYWFELEFLGEQWGLGVHDLDGNGFLDFYANHHGQKTGEIIMNFASGSPTNIYYEIPGDTHGVTFFDIDQDGDADLLQAQGAQRGTATDPDDPGLFSKVLLNDGGELSLTNSVEEFGLAYALGRKRLLVPVNFDGDLAIYVGVYNNRPDGLYPGQFFGRNAAGSYDPIDPLGPTVTGELAKGVHFGDDRFVDVINFDHFKREVSVYENQGSGFEAVTLNTSPNQILDVVTGDFDGDLRSEVLIGRAGRRDGLFRQDSSGDWVDVSTASTTAFQKSSLVIAAGDFDNDGALDYAALKALESQPGVEVHTYLNRGDGRFRLDSIFSDPDIVGQSEFMISGDFNRDGALDLLITNSYPVGGTGEGSRDGEYTLLEGVPTANNWLSIALRGVQSETGGLGARVYVKTADGKVRVLEQDSGAHFTSQNSTDLHFGLGDHAVADVRIVWPDGFAQRIDGVAANRHVVLREDRGPSFDRTVKGTPDDDRLTGSNADDRILGRDGDDRLVGRRGDDGLYGGRGDDRLFGGSGDDVLSGDRGTDIMEGGSGADVFVFDKARESQTGGRRDVIKDFQSSVDTLDLSGIDANAGRSGNQAFIFRGSDAFNGKAGRLRFENDRLEGDLDGDRRAEFQIELRDVAALRVEDILLWV